jgi:hypothetical protein
MKVWLDRDDWYVVGVGGEERKSGIPAEIPDSLYYRYINFYNSYKMVQKELELVYEEALNKAYPPIQVRNTR